METLPMPQAVVWPCKGLFANGANKTLTVFPPDMGLEMPSHILL